MNSIEKLIKQQPEDWSLKQEFYKQTDIYELEIKKIYMDSWLFIVTNQKFQIKATILYTTCFQNR